MPKAPPPKPLAAPTPSPTKETLKPVPGFSEAMSAISKEVFAPKDEAPAAPAAPKETPAPAAEAPKTPAAAEAPADATDHFATIKNPERAAEWTTFKKAANEKVIAVDKQYKAALAELETIKKATPADQADAVRLKAELKEAHDRLAVLDLQSHPDFTKQYVAPQKKALAEAQSLIADYGIEGAPELSSLLGKPRVEFSKTVSELAAKMPLADQAAFMANMRDAYRLDGEAKTALKNSGELASQLQAKSAQAQRKAFDAAMSDFEGKVKPRTVPENASAEERAEVEDFNQALSALRTTAEKNAFGKLGDREVAEVSAKAAALDLVALKVIPTMDRHIAKQNKMISDLVAELAAIKGSKSTPSASAPAGEPQGRDMSKMSPQEALRELSRQTFRAQ